MLREARARARKAISMLIEADPTIHP